MRFYRAIQPRRALRQTRALRRLGYTAARASPQQVARRTTYFGETPGGRPCAAGRCFFKKSGVVSRPTTDGVAAVACVRRKSRIRHTWDHFAIWMFGKKVSTAIIEGWSVDRCRRVVVLGYDRSNRQSWGLWHEFFRGQAPYRFPGPVNRSNVLQKVHDSRNVLVTIPRLIFVVFFLFSYKKTIYEYVSWTPATREPTISIRYNYLIDSYVYFICTGSESCCS